MTFKDFDVQIREREDPNQEYKKPELLEKAIKEIEAEVAAAAAKNTSSDSDDSSAFDSDEEEEDENANLLTPTVDSQIFKTIAAIRSKDPRVYEESSVFFNDSDEESTQAKKDKKKNKKDKKMTLKDYERDLLLKHDGFVNEYEQGVETQTHIQEQQALINEFKTAASDSDSDSEQDDFLVRKEKSSQDKKAEDDDYRKFLLENMKHDEPSKEVFKEWSNYKENPNINKEDAFLMDYVLNRGWVDKKTNDEDDEEMTGLDEEVDKDEEYLDNVDCFESKYNFRFEEEGSSQIKTYARDIEGSVRRKENKRTKRRAKEKLAKAAKKEKTMEDLKQQKNQKMHDIYAKLKEISDMTGGVKPLGLEKIDLEADFDPKLFDAHMDGVFDEKYYTNDEAMEKPVWDDDIETGLPDDDDTIMDADYLPGGERYNEENKDTKVDLKQAAGHENIKNLMEEYYSLNFEDVVGGDLYTRFKYAKTEPEDFGLTAEEILMADDAELNKYLGMRSMTPYLNPSKREKRLRDFAKNQHKKKKELSKHLKHAYKDVEKELEVIIRKEEEDTKKKMESKAKKTKKEAKQKKHASHKSKSDTSHKPKSDRKKEKKMAKQDETGKKRKREEEAEDHRTKKVQFVSGTKAEDA